MWVGGFGSFLIKAQGFHTVSEVVLFSQVIRELLIKSLEGIRNKHDPLDKVSSGLRSPISVMLTLPQSCLNRSCHGKESERV